MTPISELYVGGDQMKYSSPRQRISLRLPNSAFKKSHQPKIIKISEPQAINLPSITPSRRRSFYFQLPRAEGDRSIFNYPEPKAIYELSFNYPEPKAIYELTT